MSCIQRRWRSIQLHLVKSKKLVHYTLELHEIIKYIIINFLFYFISQTMFLYIYNKWRIFYGAEGLESRLKNRVVRWAAGYNVVRVRQSDRRFKFSQYPDSKILTTSRHEISTSFLKLPRAHAWRMHITPQCLLLPAVSVFFSGSYSEYICKAR